MTLVLSITCKTIFFNCGLNIVDYVFFSHYKNSHIQKLSTFECDCNNLVNLNISIFQKIGKKNNYSVCCGGDGEDRTLDLLNAIQALSRYTHKGTPLKLSLILTLNSLWSVWIRWGK